MDNKIKSYWDAYKPFNQVPLYIVGAMAGAIHGYCDALDIPIDKGNLETMLTIGPTVINTLANAVGGANVGLNDILQEVKDSNKDHPVTDNAVRRVLGCSFMGGVGGMYRGVFSTVAGYGIGTFAGLLVRISQ